MTTLTKVNPSGYLKKRIRQRLVAVINEVLYPGLVIFSFDRLEQRQRDNRMDDKAMLVVFRRAILEQSQSAWHKLWKCYQPIIHRKIRRELSGFLSNTEEIRDLTQVVFIKFWEDSQQWTTVDLLYSENKTEGVLSRLHSTAIFTVQRYRQKIVRKWIPLIRINYKTCSDAERTDLQNIAIGGISIKYREIFLLHLRGCENSAISSLMNLELRDVSIQINRAWERFVYVLLTHRQKNPAFDILFQYLITIRQEEKH